jgi:hypothetical protein
LAPTIQAGYDPYQASLSVDIARAPLIEASEITGQLATKQANKAKCSVPHELFLLPGTSQHHLIH